MADGVEHFIDYWIISGVKVPIVRDLREVETVIRYRCSQCSNTFSYPAEDEFGQYCHICYSQALIELLTSSCSS